MNRKQKELFKRLACVEEKVDNIIDTLKLTGCIRYNGIVYEDEFDNFMKIINAPRMLLDHFKLEIKEIPGKTVLSKVKSKKERKL